ncbi:MAG TPA: protein tyrosine phosphatase, partial [Legionella sp.]|nr:protein tyrosine phosphatase [Legionella sp.]
KIIAVHNNEDYSLDNYLPGHDLAADARALHVNKQHFFRNFYLVTQKKDYKRLSQLKFNSILQAAKATDDGSLSVFLASTHYINVEAGYDQLAAQIKMLRRA